MSIVKAENSVGACEQCANAKRDSDWEGYWYDCALGLRGPKFISRDHRTLVNTYECDGFEAKRGDE